MTVSPIPAQSLRCSFCRKSQDVVWKLFAGRDAAICTNASMGALVSWPRAAAREAAGAA
jgi:hypothetical protein